MLLTHGKPKEDLSRGVLSADVSFNRLTLAASLRADRDKPRSRKTPSSDGRSQGRQCVASDQDGSSEVVRCSGILESCKM